MFIHSTETNLYADLGAAWILHQTFRIHQTYLQFGRHFRVDVDSLVDRTARRARSLKWGIHQ